MTDDTDPDEPGAGYDELATRDDEDDEWATPWGDNPLQRYYSWPETRDLLSPVDGAEVLDAGCGVGDHAAWLLGQGASVVGVDASERAAGVARDRLGDRATVRHHDLTDGLTFVDDDAFDVVLSHLVLDHVESLAPVFGEFHRALTPGGALVFSMVHPMQFYLAYDVDTYYDVTPVEIGWDAPVTSYHRPMAAILDPLADAGFTLDAIREPRPSDEYLQYASEEWCVDERPQVVCVRAIA